MTQRELSVAAKVAMNAQQTREVFITLLTIDHETFTEPMRVASDSQVELPVAGERGVVSRGEEYVFCPFEMTLAAQDDTGIATATISIDNIDRRVVQKLRESRSKVSVVIEIVLASDPDSVELQTVDFRLDEGTYDVFTVSGDISVEYFDLEPFPSGRMNPSNFQGMF